MNIIRVMRSKHIYLLFLIFFILSTMSAFLWLMSDALKQHFNFTASEVLGADGSIESGQPFSQELYRLAKTYPVQLSQTINFTSMAITDKQSVLAHVRAIDHAYPLKGEVKIQTDSGVVVVQPKLAPNQMWIDEALSSRLGVNIFDFIQLGHHHFQIAGIILSEPARAGMAFMLAPKIMIRLEEVDKTALIQPYSKILYQLFIKSDNQVFFDFTEQVKNQDKDLKVYSVQEGRPFENSIFHLAERYVGVFIIITVMLSGLGIVVLAKAYAADNILMVALLRTFGGSLQQIRNIYFYGFLFFGLGIILLSLACAISFVAILSYFFPDYLAFNITYLSSVGFAKIVFMQVAIALIMLFGFAFVPIMQTVNISPIYLFRKEMAYQAAWPIYVSVIGVIFVLLLFYIQDYHDVLILFSYLFFSAIGLFFCFYGISSGCKIFSSRKKASSALLTQFSILFLLSGLLWVMANDFFGNWLLSIPENVPNQFMINITDRNKKDIESFWQKENIHLTVLPMLTARLKQVNNQPRDFHRALNISYMASLPADNKILAGKKWDNTLQGNPVISIEQHFAKTIQAKIGDNLTFDIGGQEITGKIINIRSLQWESFKPNFYVIFPDQILEKFPKTYITSLYLSPDQMYKTNSFLKQFPGVSIIDIKLSLDQIKFVLSQVVRALQYMIGVMFALVLLVYYAMLSITFLERQYESALLRSFGASKHYLLKLMLLEFGLIGGISGAVGMAGAIILAIFLSKQLSITYHPHWELILIGMGLGALLTMMMGWLSTYKVINTSPLILLKEVN